MKNSKEILLKNFLQTTNLEKTNTSSFISGLKDLQVSTFSLKMYLSNRDAFDNNVDVKIFNSYFDTLKNSIINNFGGLCHQQINGYYKSGEGRIMNEKISEIMFHNFDPSLDLKTLNQTLEIYFEYGRLTCQECLMLTLNNSTSLIFL